MEKRHRDLIKRNLSNLVSATKYSAQLEQKLVEKGVFSQEHVDRINNPHTDSASPEHSLYLRIQSRGPEAFAHLISALVESGNMPAARILDSTLAENNPPANRIQVWSSPIYQEDPSTGDSNLPTFIPSIPSPIHPSSTTPLQVEVVLSQNWEHLRSQVCYNMLAQPRGQCLIIDNEDFTDVSSLRRRTGSVVDANNLDILFSDLGFKVTLRRNLDYREMFDEVRKFSEKEEHRQADMAVVCVMSHGRHGHIAACDGREIEEEWLLRQFNNMGCPALKGKPKLFILQACRGDQLDYGVSKIDEFDSPTQTDAKKIDPPPTSAGDHKDSSWEDMLIAYATIPGYVANRDTCRGTWFIESLVQVFMSRAHNTDLRDMLDLVAGRLRQYESEFGTKQSFDYVVRHFYKKLFFNPGLRASQALSSTEG